jgi:DNA polymerase-1
MGNVALTSVLGMKGITKVRGAVLTSPEFPGVFFIPTIHPAAALRRWEDRALILHDFQLASRVAEKGYSVKEVDYHVCGTVSEVESILSRLASSVEDYISFDVETTGFDYRKDRLLCLSLSNRRGTGWVIPFVGQNERQIWSPEDLQQVQSLLRDFFSSDVPLSAHNGVFDTLFLRGAMGIEVRNWVLDTMLLHHVVEENLAHDLGTVCSWYTDVSPYKEKLHVHLSKQAASFATVPEDVLWQYSASDADVEYRVSGALVKDAVEDDVLCVHDRIMLPMAKVLREAEWDGVYVNPDTLNSLHEDYLHRLTGLEQDIFQLAGREFNIDSSKQKAEVLFDELGLSVVKETPGGNRSCDAEVLSTLTKQHPIAQKLVDYGTLSHDIKTYLKGLDGESGLLKYIHADGRVHPRWLLHRAVTGRLASADPNIQAIKRDGPMRSLFAATPDWFWLHADFSQMEVRVIAYVAPDETLIRLFQEGQDVHQMVASQMFGCKYDEVTDAQREQAKGVVFGINYGRGPYTLADEFGISVEKAEQYIEAYFTLFGGVRLHHENVKRLIDSTGVAVTPFKRKRHLRAAADMRSALQSRLYSERAEKEARRTLAEMYRQAINFTIQSTASDVLCLASIRIYERFRRSGMRSRMLLSHHDAWGGEAPEEELEDAVAIVKEEMERPVPELGNAIFPVEFEIGRFWGDDSVVVKGIG